VTRAKRFALAWAPACAYMALIWAVSSIAIPFSITQTIPLRDKGVHFVEYAILGFLVAQAVRRSWPKEPWLRTALFSLWVAFAWGVLDELHQAFVPGRSGDTLDLIADLAGAATGVAARYAARERWFPSWARA
jgi:VanZ family protein